MSYEYTPNGVGPKPGSMWTWSAVGAADATVAAATILRAHLENIMALGASKELAGAAAARSGWSQHVIRRDLTGESLPV